MAWDDTASIQSPMAQLTASAGPSNPFTRPRELRRAILARVRIEPTTRYNGKGFLCALINSRCHVGCDHCMFFSNMQEGRNSFNTMTAERVSKLMELVRASNTGYLLVSGGGEGFLEPQLMYKIAEETSADLTWLVTSAFWARKSDQATEVLSKLHAAHLRGKAHYPTRRICVRISVDRHHVARIADDSSDPLRYVANAVKVFESEYLDETDFFLQIHGLEGEEDLIEQLCERISARAVSGASSIHTGAKVTESAVRYRLPSGYELDVTYAKLLLSDLAADLRDHEMLQKRVAVWEKDAFINQHGHPALQINPDGTVGTNMLVIYDGRVAGGWQSEMPDVQINLDTDSYKSVIDKSLSDPGVLATIERGIQYRFGKIDEVSPNATLRAKAVNVRDYTSPVLLEEDALKLYYTIRALQDFILDGRVPEDEMKRWPAEVRELVNHSPSALRDLYKTSAYDIVRQFEETEPGFAELSAGVRAYAANHDEDALVTIATRACAGDLRRLDKWRLLFERIAHGWYDISAFSEAEIARANDVERIIDRRVLFGRRIYEGLSRFWAGA